VVDKVCRAVDVRSSITLRQHRSIRRLIEAVPRMPRTTIPGWLDGGADEAETTYTPFSHENDAAPVRLIVRRVRPIPRPPARRHVLYNHDAFITDRGGETLELETDHRYHAERTRFAISSTAWRSTICRRAGSRRTGPSFQHPSLRIENGTCQVPVEGQRLRPG
jgi:hypothetical protein